MRRARASLFLMGMIAMTACGSAVATPSSTQTPSDSQPLAAPTAAATIPTAVPTALPSDYPPATVTGLHALAGTGNASAISEFHSESVGLASCPEPKREVTVASSLTGRALAADLLAYFYAQGLDNDCGSLVLAYHDPSETGNPYTAGRIDLTVSGSHVLTVDSAADFTPGSEFKVSY
jgi:hypothetical protein